MGCSALLLALVLLARPMPAQKIKELEQKILGLMSILKTEIPPREAYQRCGCSSPPTVVKYGAKIGWVCEQYRDRDPKKHDESSCGEICIGPPKGQQSPTTFYAKIAVTLVVFREVWILPPPRFAFLPNWHGHGLQTRLCSQARR